MIHLVYNFTPERDFYHNHIVYEECYGQHNLQCLFLFWKITYEETHTNMINKINPNIGLV